MPMLSADDLRSFATALLGAGGFTPEDARQTADLLVWANLHGVDSHGVLRIPRYVEMVEKGLIVSGGTIETVRSTGAITVLDGGRCPGAVGLNRAVEVAAALAPEHGLGWCAIRNTSHCGAIGYYTGALARQGLVGIAMSASKPLMSYYGAKGEALSTNPLSIAVPSASGAPVVLDMSTAAVALGKIMAAKDAGRAIPEGWGVDADGQPTTDPAQVDALLPMAGPKGSGLSLMIELLASVLAGAPVIAPSLLKTGKGAFNGMVMAVDPAAFGAPEDFLTGVAELETAIHGLSPAGESPVLLPGERGRRTAAERAATGIPLAAGTVAKLTALATAQGIAVPAALG